MKLGRLVTRSLRLYWKTGAVVAFGVAVATSVIVGSLVVGDSVRGSVRDTALDRLGGIDCALVSPRPFRRSLASDIARHPALSGDTHSVAAVVLRQGVLTADATGAVVPRVNVIGTSAAFWGFWSASEEPGLNGRRAAVNASLARDLQVARGDFVLLTIGRRGAAPIDTLFGRRGREHTVRQLRLEVAAVLPDSGAGCFALVPGTATPRNVFVALDWLTEQAGEPDAANAVLVQSASGAPDGIDVALQQALRDICTLFDYGFRVTPNIEHGHLVVESTGLLLSEPQVEAAITAASRCHSRADRTSVYLADAISKTENKENTISYAVVCGFEPLGSLPLEQGRVQGSGPAFALINSWAAADLGAAPGDRLDLSFLVSKSDGSYEKRMASLDLEGIVAFAGPAADRRLTPDFEGITDAKTINDWDPPFPFDRERVTKRDEAYWESHRATPKVFVPLETVRSMWLANRGGAGDWITSIRITPPSGEDLEAFSRRYEAALLAVLTPEASGLVFRPVRQEAIAASRGATDFGVLFLLMSMLLVCSGCGLAGMLMRLSVERRASQTGILLATGFRAATAGRLVLAEGAILVGIGAALGLPLGVLYAAGVVSALRTWWIGAVGTSALWLHVDARSVVIGLVSGPVVGLLSVWWGMRRLRKRAVLDLLLGRQALAALPPGKRASMASLALGVSALGIAGSLVVWSALAPEQVSAAAAFFGAGAALLVAALAFCYLALATVRRRGGRAVSIGRLAMRSAAVHRGRSMLVVGLLACAAFVLVTVAANERNLGRGDVFRRTSGSGGFLLCAESSLPLHYDLGTAEGRSRLGFRIEDELFWKDAEVVSFLLRSGGDISCLNIAAPPSPRVLGVGRRMIERGGFSVKTFRRSVTENPWNLLLEDSADGIQAFADSETAMWQLHKALGDEITVPDESGAPAKLRLAGLISSSIFASELLVSEEHFRRMFPSESGPRYFLVAAPPVAADALAASLRRTLGEMGMEVRTTRSILDALAGVRNTYLMTFLTLGGLGVLLGTVGLVVVLLRNALERRSEFALMLATGLRRRTLAVLLVAENAGLLAAGILSGTVAALAAVAPQLASVESTVNWTALVLLLVGIIIVGLSSCVVAAAGIVRGDIIEALRAE